MAAYFGFAVRPKTRCKKATWSRPYLNSLHVQREQNGIHRQLLRRTVRDCGRRNCDDVVSRGSLDFERGARHRACCVTLCCRDGLHCGRGIQCKRSGVGGRGSTRRGAVGGVVNRCAGRAVADRHSRIIGRECSAAWRDGRHCDRLNPGWGRRLRGSSASAANSGRNQQR